MDFLGFQNRPKKRKSTFYLCVAYITIEIYCQLSIDYTFFNKICKICNFEPVMSKKLSFFFKFGKNH